MSGFAGTADKRRTAERIEAALDGEEGLAGLSIAAVQMPIHLEATRILSLPKPVRRAEIEAHPLSGMVADEVTRLWHYRRQLPN